MTRHQESLRALQHLGVDPACVSILGYPDRGLGALWGDHWLIETPFRSRYTLRCSSPYNGTLTPEAPYVGQALLADLTTLLQREKPTLCVYPHPLDAHGDHAVRRRL